MRDYPAPASSLTISLSSTATSLTTTDSSVLPANFVIEVDYEAILCTASLTSITTSCIRGWAGTTAVSHANSSTILIRPGYLSVDIIEALNSAKDEMYPPVYKAVVDTSLTGDSATYEFTVPNMPLTYGGDTIPIPYLSRIYLKRTGDLSYKILRDWRVERGATPKIHFKRAPIGGTIRVHGLGPFPDLSASTDSMDTQFPKVAEHAITLGAASRLLGSGEAGRTRLDVGARDDREAAVRPGNAISLGTQLERRFE